ncbi:hypothetical protein J2W42_004000 [Rhizobium tibeticum]|uniref:Uncharacterized protein n=1 Tax=Rhizobium tibeticum TaxID=501024 RepID=A0A1H8VIM7_9HYPH|nr:hypothetical protein [Rhizobium tibeticum]MDP9811137.1 hypothetical protein [Rhizobium tibeticum]SEI19047.1 hypothetical protein RTCCBAU85039_6065 [Rhizobium tibeticum]SEP15312.1 hypothetical protein SAMN05216228_104320 [Rhizobium tibeticum]
MNFLASVDLTDEHLDTVTTSIKGWCANRKVDLDGPSARAAIALALELLSTRPSITSEELLEILSNRLSSVGSD